MGELHYSIVTDSAELDGFDCGNSSINELIANCFYRNMLRQSLIYKVCVGTHRVGFYSVSILSISFEHSDSPLSECYDKTPFFGAIILDFIAVDKRVHNQNIGSDILTYVVQNAKDLYRKWPIRVLVLDALRERVPWYLKRGFDLFNESDLKTDSETIRLYLDLMPDQEKTYLDEYVSTFGP